MPSSAFSRIPFFTSSLRFSEYFFGHRNVDVVHEFILRTGVFRDDSIFFDQMHLDSEVFDQLLKRDRIRAITVKTVCLLDQDEAAVRARLEDTHHFSELFASWVLGRFDIHELSADLHSPKTRILRQQFLLGGN